jgi:hypothetical protein
MKKHWQWFGAAGAVAMLAVLAVSCGGTGGGGGHSGNPDVQFILNSNNAGRLILNIDPAEVDANKSDRIGLVATLTDNLGNPLIGVIMTFTSDIPDISFIPGGNSGGRNFGQAVTDSHGNADIIAVAGSTPTGTGAIVGTGAIFARPPLAFGLRAQTAITLLDVGFIDSAVFSVIPASADVTEPAPGTVVFFNITGGTPPYELKNEVSGIGAAVISQHCLPGCTENGGVLCIGSPCQSDVDCGAGSPDGTCVGPISRCLASCHGTNCAGSRCAVDADCNDGSPTPANVCKDSGQSIAYIISASGAAGTHVFTVEDSIGEAIAVTVNVSFVCGNGVARGAEQCDLGDVRGQTCTSLGFAGGGTLGCDNKCEFDTSNCEAVGPSPGATPTGPTPTGVTPTPTPGGGGVTATPTGPTTTPTPGIGLPSNLTLALLTACAGDNGNGTLTTIVAATVTDTNSNPVPNNTSVAFSIAAPSGGAVISSPSGTNTDPTCDVSSFVTACMVVTNQPGVANTCITYPVGQSGTLRSVTGVSGAANDTRNITLP